MDAASRGAAWLADETIIFATANAGSGLQRVAAAGGAVRTLTRPNRDRGESAYLWPEALPDNHGVLFTIMPLSGGLDGAQVALYDLATRTQQILVQGGSHAHYVAGGYLTFASGTALRALAFKLTQRRVQGIPTPVVSRVVTTTFGAADFSVSQNGTLVYADAAGGLARTPVWVDRQGREQPISTPPRPYLEPRLSPDGTRILLYSAEPDWDLWLWDTARETLTRLTSDPANDAFGAWTPDGRRIVFSSSRRGGVMNVFWEPADGTSTAERLTESPNGQYPSAVTPDGTQLVFHEQNPKTGRLDLKVLTLGASRRATALLTTRFNESNGVVSPDNHWLAYQSDSSGRYEIYVRPFPNVEDGVWLISTSGGTQPLWSRDGHELFYVPPDGGLTLVPVQLRGGMWGTGAARDLIKGHYHSSNRSIARDYDVSPDGRRFLMLKQTAADSKESLPQIVVVQHWDEELKRLVPK